MYLSKITIDNFKGIEHLEVNFSPKTNIIIGENGRCKSALIDAIRLLYNIGEPIREISVSKEDFHDKIIVNPSGGFSSQKADLIRICYEFEGLSDEQKGAFYEYMVVDPARSGKDYAKVEIQYRQDKKYPLFSYKTGNIDGQKADINTFRLFQHYYLSALRDSTKDLLNVRNNILGKVIKRLVERNDSEEAIKDIIREANSKLLEREEVVSTRNSINSNLDNIYKNVDRSQIGLHIEQSRIEYIVNVIKPYLPHDWQNHSLEGFQLWQNSLGFNNLIYIATVLGDIKERALDDAIPHFALLIEEPEAHIHPQLQLSLYNFLKDANQAVSSQLFITTHSPTLTSKVPFENLILLDKDAYKINESFTDRASENLIQDTTRKIVLSQADIDVKKNQLLRYIDVTKSQLFFAKGCLFVEGISEELLISAFSRVKGFNLEDYRIELVNVDGVSFYPFLFLFNSTSGKKRLPKKVAILTDDDRFPPSKREEYNLEKLAENNYQILDSLHDIFTKGNVCNRVNNLISIRNNQSNVSVKSAFQTLEYDLCLSNVADTKTELFNNFLYKYIASQYSTEFVFVENYLKALPDNFNSDQKGKLAILLWKCIPDKATFAQDFSLHITENIEGAQTSFNVPLYIQESFTHLKQ